MIRVAVLMACHNRRSKTIAFLSSLAKQIGQTDFSLTTYLVDDGSTDGTFEAVANYENVHIIRGDGTWYWNYSMYVAFAAAMRDGYDGYLWVNDDIVLDDDAIVRTLQMSAQFNPDSPRGAIIVGATRDPDSGKMTYGGFVRLSRFKRLSFTRVEPCDQPVPLETVNGNFVYIPHWVARQVGNFDPKFIQTSGDMDYGLRARAIGVQIWLMPGTIGTCASNPKARSWTDPRIGLRQRWAQVNDPKAHGLLWSNQHRFAKRHGGPFWIFFVFWPYRHLIFAKSKLKVPSIPSAKLSIPSAQSMPRVILPTTLDSNIIEEELDRWRSRRLIAPFWWRDDDAMTDGEAFQRLLGISNKYTVPLILAVSPKLIDGELCTKINRMTHIGVAAHGLYHANHGSPSRKAEFGPDRPLADMRRDIEALSTEFASRFPERGLAMFVPPWHALDPRLIPDLERAGFKTLSMMDRRLRRATSTLASYLRKAGFSRARTEIQPNTNRGAGIARIDCSIDLLRYDGPAGAKTQQRLVQSVVGALVARRFGLIPINRPIGILTHHRQHDEPAWNNLNVLIQTLKLHSSVRFIEPEEISLRFVGGSRA